MANIHERGLFPPLYTGEVERPYPIRPLGPLSDYVVEELPQELEAARVGSAEIQELSNSVEKKVASVPRSVYEAIRHDPRRVDMALLDLIFLQAGIASLDGVPGPATVRHTTNLARAAGRIPTLTYEDLIFVNPLQGDPRVFTTGDLARTELDFYEVHNRAEKRLARLNDASFYATELLSQRGRNGVEEAVEVLNNETIQADRRTIVSEHMRSVGFDMQEPHFRIIRGYYTGYPKGVFDGPSGAFTASFPVFETILAGEILPEERKQYNRERWQYFPRQGQQDLVRAYQVTDSGNSLNAQSLRLGDPPQLLDALMDMDRFLRNFRNLHIQGVANEIPGALEGERAGTGGEKQVGVFLKKRAEQRLIVR